ncbi:12927_t:CDS:2, partial [Acaulospora colombiana]
MNSKVSEAWEKEYKLPCNSSQKSFLPLVLPLTDQPCASFSRMDENEKIGLNCWTVGTSAKDAILIKIRPNKNVHDLKRAIWKAQELKSFEKLSSLSLMKVDLDFQVSNDQANHLDENSVMEARFPLSNYWSSQPPSDRIHVVVRTNVAPAKTPPRKQYQYEITPSKDEVTRRTERLEPSTKDRIVKLLKNGVELPRWRLQHGPEEMCEWVDRLELPALKPNSPFPSLLLHKLGKMTHDKHLSEHLVTILDHLEIPGRLIPLPQENITETLNRNQVDGEIVEEHKRQWLLVQVVPEQLLGADIFEGYLHALGRPSFDDLHEYISNEKLNIYNLLREDKIFCVLDEAQSLTHKFENCFRSDKDRTVPRPILRELINTWGKKVYVVICGTGISMQKMKNATNSAIVKLDEKLPPWTDVGAFDTKESQTLYLAQYLPSNYMNSLLAERLEYWLCGRYRFTTTYLQFLLKNGLGSPHSVLNEYILAVTNREVAEEGLPQESPLRSGLKSEIKERMSGQEADFISLQKKFDEEPSFKHTFTSFFYECLLTGKMRSVGGESGDLLVELGISRFKQSGPEQAREAETTERIMILKLCDFFETLKMTMESHLIHELGASNPSSRGIAFEPFGAFLLARAFSSPRPLSEVFDFLENCTIQDEPAELVTLRKIDGQFKCTRLDIKSDMQSQNIGRSPSDPEAMLEWLEDPKGVAFCFPPNTVGPDLVLVLRLTRTNTVLRVVVQFKNTANLSGTARAKETRELRESRIATTIAHHRLE